MSNHPNALTTPAALGAMLEANARALYPESATDGHELNFSLFAEIRGEMNGNRQAVRPFLEPRILQHVDRWRRGDQAANAAFIKRVHHYRLIAYTSATFSDRFQGIFGYSFDDNLYEDLWEQLRLFHDSLPDDCTDLHESMRDLRDMLAAGTMLILQYRAWGQSDLMFDELRVNQVEGDFRPYAMLSVQVAATMLQPRVVA